MKLDIEQLKSEFESGLNTQNWFKSVGKHSLDIGKNFASFCVKFVKFEQLSKLLNQTNETISILIYLPKIAVLAIKFYGSTRLRMILLTRLGRFYRLKKSV